MLKSQVAAGQAHQAATAPKTPRPVTHSDQ